MNKKNLDDSFEVQRIFSRIKESLDSESSEFKCVKLSNRLENKIVLSEYEDILDLKKEYFSSIMWKGAEKIAEASYSEVYLLKGLVYKIIPFTITKLENFYKEIYILKTFQHDEIEGVCGIVDCLLLSGKYPKDLCKAWNKFDRSKKSENANPGLNNQQTIYGVISMKYGGIDLEHYNNFTTEYIYDFFNQVLGCLAFLEEKYKFEHRDLHWGNILIQECGKITLIDFTLSRMESIHGITFTDLKNEVVIFTGDGDVDPQFNVYREMRTSNNNEWYKFNPFTNVLWTRYLVDKVCKKCNIKSLQSLSAILRRTRSAKKAYEKFKTLNKINFIYVLVLIIQLIYICINTFLIISQ